MSDRMAANIVVSAFADSEIFASISGTAMPSLLFRSTTWLFNSSTLRVNSILFIVIVGILDRDQTYKCSDQATKLRATMHEPMNNIWNYFVRLNNMSLEPNAGGRWLKTTQTVQSPLGKSVTSAPTCNEHLLQIMNELNTAPMYNLWQPRHAIHVNW